jgi:hypothetical protein
MGWVENADGTVTITDDAASGGGPAEDMQKIHDVAVRLGGLLKGTRQARENLTASQARNGWVFVETDTGCVYERISGEWRLIAGGNRLTTFRSNVALPGVVTPLIRTGLASGRTEPGGQLIHNFAESFPSACIGVVLMVDNQSNFAPTAGAYPYLIATTVTRQGFQSFWPDRANTEVATAFIAYGY